MKDQYLAEIQFKDFRSGKWINASLLLGDKRFLSSREEAGKAIKRVLLEFNKGSRVETHKEGCISVGVVVDSETADNFTVVKTRVRHRQVTEWEEV